MVQAGHRYNGTRPRRLPRNSFVGNPTSGIAYHPLCADLVSNGFIWEYNKEPLLPRQARSFRAVLTHTRSEPKKPVRTFDPFLGDSHVNAAGGRESAGIDIVGESKFCVSSLVGQLWFRNSPSIVLGDVPKHSRICSIIQPNET